MEIVSPTDEKGRNQLNVIIKGSNNEVIRRMCVDSSMCIRQVKLDIGRMKYVCFLFFVLESYRLDERE